MNIQIQNLFILLTILFIVSNVDTIHNIIVKLKSKKNEYFINHQILNYNVYINNYQDIYNNNTLKSYFSELIDNEKIDQVLLVNEIKSQSMVCSLISNFKPIAAICICKVEVLKKYFDKNGITETYINPLQNGYFVYNYLLHPSLYNHKIDYFNCLMKEVEKWTEYPTLYECNTNSISQSNFINNIYFVNDKVYKNLPKANFILVFGNKLPEHKQNGSTITHNKIANLVYNNQFILDWSKQSILNKYFKVKPTNSNNIYIHHKPYNKTCNKKDHFDICKNNYLKQNGYSETAYNFINNKTFYIKFIPRNISLYRSRQVSITNNEPYNY